MFAGLSREDISDLLADPRFADLDEEGYNVTGPSAPTGPRKLPQGLQPRYARRFDDGVGDEEDSPEEIQQREVIHIRKPGDLGLLSIVPKSGTTTFPGSLRELSGKSVPETPTLPTLDLSMFDLSKLKNLPNASTTDKSEKATKKPRGRSKKATGEETKKAPPKEMDVVDDGELYVGEEYEPVKAPFLRPPSSEFEVNQTPIELNQTQIEEDETALGLTPEEVEKLVKQNGEAIENGTSDSTWTKILEPNGLKNFFKSAAGLQNEEKSSGTFMKLLKNYGIPSVLGIASTFFGIPPSVGFGIGSAINPFSSTSTKLASGFASGVAAEGGITQIAKAAIEAGGQVLGTTLPVVITTLLNNSIRLARLIASLGQSFLSTATSYIIRGCKSIFNYFTKNQKKCILNSKTLVDQARKYTERAIAEASLEPARKKTVMDTGVRIRELKESEIGWQEVLDKIGVLWENCRMTYATPFQLPPEQIKEYRERFENFENEINFPDDEYTNQAFALLREFKYLANRFLQSYSDGKFWRANYSVWRTLTSGALNPLRKVREGLWRDPFVILQQQMNTKVLNPIRMAINDLYAVSASAVANVSARRAQELTALTGDMKSGQFSDKGLIGFGRKSMTKKKRARKYVGYYAR